MTSQEKTSELRKLKPISRTYLVLTLLTMILVGLFLPASIIYWLVIIPGAIGFIWLWLYLFGQFAKNGTGSAFLGLIVLVPAGIIGGAVFGVALLFIIPLLIPLLWPSAINLIASHIVVSSLPFSKVLKVFSFICVSALLGFNVQLLALFQDASIPQSGKFQSSQILNLPSDEFISVETNIKKIEFHPLHDYELLGFGASEGCSCAYWDTPRLVVEDIKRVLQEEGLRYKVEDRSSGKNRLIITANNKKYGLLQVDISLYQYNEKIANYQRLVRSYYPLEPNWSDITLNKSFDDLDRRIYFLTKSNFWNLIASIKNSELKKPIPFIYGSKMVDESVSLFKYFVQHSISNAVKERQENSPLDQDLTSELIPEDSIDYFKLSDFGKTSECVGRENKKDGVEEFLMSPDNSLSVAYRQSLLFRFDGKELQITPKIQSEPQLLLITKTYCSDSTYTIVLSSDKRDRIYIQEYSYDGRLLATQRVLFPSDMLLGKYHGRIDDLRANQQAYTFKISAMGDYGRPMQSYWLSVKKPKN